MSEIAFQNLGPGDYDRGKTVFNKAKHPGFVGRELFFRCATTGVACVAVIDGIDCGIALVAKQKLQALSVITAAQGRGVGPALMARLRPRWVSSIGERVGFFEKLGYRAVGAPKVGQNGKHSTQLMELAEGTEIAAPPVADAKPIAAAPAAAPVLSTPSFLSLVNESTETRIEAELEIMDALMTNAVAADKPDVVLRVIEAANKLLEQRDKFTTSLTRRRADEDRVRKAKEER